ncbi:MAG: AsnC family transcriptional regulator [Cypionkella sp.]
MHGSPRSAARDLIFIQLDSFDLSMLAALQRDGAMTNDALSEIVNLSAAQCSRR